MSSKKDYVLQLYLDITKSDMLHLGYWDDGDKVNLENVPHAQKRYVDYLFKKIPTEAKTILDVGCGTGSASNMLQDKGYKVECVSPDMLLKEKIEKKYGPGLKLYCTKFEKLDIDRKYDLILMMESCEYLKLDKAFMQCRRYLTPGGRILISDMFRTTDEKDYKALHTVNNFKEKLEKNGFKIISESDITPNILPTLDILNTIYSRYILPVSNTVVQSLDHSIKKRKAYSFLWKILKFIFRKNIKKSENDIFKRIPLLIDRENFRSKVKYMVYELQAG